MKQNALLNRNQTTNQALGDYSFNEDIVHSSAYQESDYTRDRVTYNKSGLDSYDFCSELHDNTRPPYTLDCLKKEFLREGGQPGGQIFPDETNLTFWNSHKSWLEVKSAIRRLSLETDSANRAIQQKAIVQFYGILVDPKKMPFQGDPGLEVFWFTHSNDLTAPTTFLGRRIRTTIPFINRQLLNDNGSQIKKDQISIIYFTNLKVYDNTAIRIRVTADDGFSTHFNSPMTKFTNMKRLNTSEQLTSLTYMAPTTFTMNNDWILKKYGSNQLSGYYHQGLGGFYYNLEYWNSQEWVQIPETMLSLTRDPFSPMFSFEIEKSPPKYGCDFPFCDRRFGGHKMKWVSDLGGGPNWDYSTVPNKDYPFGKSCMVFSPGGGGITSKFSLKLYSFMTITLLVNIKSIPARSTDIFTLISPLGQIAICLKANSQNSVYAYLSTSNNGESVDNPVIHIGEPYLIILRMLRNEYDVNSLNSIQIGAMSLRSLQIDPKKIKESKPILYKNPLSLENPTSKNAYTVHMGGQVNMIVYWLHFFDYALKLEHIKKESVQMWDLPPNT
jgi:hypothetical protein